MSRLYKTVGQGKRGVGNFNYNTPREIQIPGKGHKIEIRIESKSILIYFAIYIMYNVE